ncbi:hypothetical protein FRC12_023392 [Ceratobasidium sp. 428]|nr:hypothetical protein FRC12_023392 [Ceratobasidium sp. 428]
MANEEYDSYKQSSSSADEVNVDGVTSAVEDINANNDGGPGVIPLQYLGVMDNDQSGVPTDELMNWGLDNLVRQADCMQKSGYAIRRGAPVNMFRQPPAGEGPADLDWSNFWEAGFLFLFANGVGGIKSDRPVPLSPNEHGRWALGYHDKQF